MSNRTPRKAILLAAGFGTRIQPLSHDLPKPMMPIWGEPAVVHMVNLLKSFGVREILINLHHNPAPIFNHFRLNPVAGMKIEFSFEPEILGTGGALHKAAWFINNEPFWLANTDIAADVSQKPFLAEFDAKHPLAVLWLHPELGPRTVEMSGNRITNFRSPTPGAGNTFTFCGLQLLSPAIFNYLGKPGFSSVIEAYSAAMGDGRRISGITVDKSFWSDIGNPEQYIDVHRQILASHRYKRPGARLFARGQFNAMKLLRRRGITISGFASIGRDVTVGRGTKICDSILWDRAVIKESTNLVNAIVARDTTVSGNVQGMAIRCDKIPGDTAMELALRGISWQPAETTAIALGARGSARSFTRLQHSDRSAIFIRYSREREENIHYASIAEFLLKEGIPVPRVMFDSPEKCATIMEDAGDCSLETCARRMSEKQIEAAYRKSIDALLLLHGIPAGLAERQGIALQPPFARKLYKWERDLMAQHFLANRLSMRNPEINGIMGDLETVARKLSKARQVLVHRDMQSSNILLRKSGVVFIDFQGLRYGPAAYDLASLLCDPYAMLSADLQSSLIRYYDAACRNGRETGELFWYAAVERLAQALGAYGRLGALPGTSRFDSYIPPAMQMMARALSHVSGLENLRKLVREQIRG